MATYRGEPEASQALDLSKKEARVDDKALAPSTIEERNGRWELKLLKYVYSTRIFIMYYFFNRCGQNRISRRLFGKITLIIEICFLIV